MSLQFLCEKSKIVSLVSSFMTSIAVSPSHSKFSVQLICYIAFGSASSACCLLKSITVSI